MSENKRLPKSDFGKSVGEDVILYLAEIESLEPLELLHALLVRICKWQP